MHNSGALRAAGRKHAFDEYECATLSAVIVRESGRSSIPETLMIELKGRSVLDTPHARGMTIVARAKRSRPTISNKARLIARRAQKKSGGAEAEHAVGFRCRQAAFDQHVIDMGDQLAGGEAHLVH